MFGVWRTMLALSVVAYHLLYFPVIGQYAVFSFFVLSGFLMTTIMHESYGYQLAGLRRYAINRFLRLYPAYWVAAALGLLVICFCGEAFTRGYMAQFYIPVRLDHVLENVAMVFPRLMPNTVAPRLSPPTWALTIEITYYLAIGLGLSKTRRRAWLWLAASLIYVLATLVLHLPYKYRYGAIPAGSLPFSVGACLYLYKDEARRLLDRLRLGFWRLGAINLGIFAVFATLSLFGFAEAHALGLYLIIPAAAALLVRLADGGVPGVPRGVDKIVGDFSYPIYLLHWQMGALASYLLFRRPVIGLTALSAASLALALLLVGLVSAAIIFVMDPSIETLRSRIRRHSRAVADAVTAGIGTS